MLGFADDLALVAFSKDPLVLVSKINDALASIDIWKIKGLELVPIKSKAIIFSGKKALLQLNIFMRDQGIPVVWKTKYLGIILDIILTFRPHINQVTSNTRNMIAFLSRFMPNINCPSDAKRRLIISIMNSRLLYCAPVWMNSISKFSTCRDTFLKTITALGGSNALLVSIPLNQQGRLVRSICDPKTIGVPAQMSVGIHLGIDRHAPTETDPGQLEDLDTDLTLPPKNGRSRSDCWAPALRLVCGQLPNKRRRRLFNFLKAS